MSFTGNVLLGVNIDHAATLRQARYREAQPECGGCVEPDPVLLARLAEQAGADGITIHLREDRRHIQEHDVRRLREVLATRMNLEMACTETMVAFAREIVPESVCLVPENRQEVTTEGGLDVVRNEAAVAAVVEGLAGRETRISLFIDPDEAQVRQAAGLGAAMIELHTGAYANARGADEVRREGKRLREAAALGSSLGLLVNAGHGINYVNVSRIMQLGQWHELNIGHSIISRALFTGILEAVREMKKRMADALA